MSALTELGGMYQSRRMARDILERRGNVLTHPWWPTGNVSRGFSADPNPDREPPECSPVWITIGTGSVPPK